MSRTSWLLVGLALLWAPLAGQAQEKSAVKEGQPAPDVTLPAVGVEKAVPGKADAQALRLSDLKGKNVVLFFFPKAMTKG